MPQFARISLLLKSRASVHGEMHKCKLAGRHFILCGTSEFVEILRLESPETASWARFSNDFARNLIFMQCRRRYNFPPSMPAPAPAFQSAPGTSGGRYRIFLCNWFLLNDAQFSPIGLSPRVRGTFTPWQEQRLNWRFIPACAGNMLLAAAVAGHLPVHPRVCGEHALSRDDCAPYQGSSPRVRGTWRKRRNILL